MVKRKKPPARLTMKALLKRASIRDIAEALQNAKGEPLSTQAVYAWGEYVPQLRVYELQILRPEWFTRL